MKAYAFVMGLPASIFGSPDYDRLKGAIAETKIDLARQSACSAANDWAKTATQFLGEAETYLKAWNIQQGWCALMSAQRAILSNPSDTDRVRRTAIMLRRESNKLDGWRSRAIADLICDADGELVNELKNNSGSALSSEMTNRVIDAVALRDDSANTSYHKILLRRRNLFHLFLVLSTGIIVCIGLSIWKKLPAPFSDTRTVIAVILFGVLGAALSVAQGLLTTDVKAKIPSQQIGAFIVWMRPGIGATAALVAFAMVWANHTLGTFLKISTDFAVIAVVAFAAGFSERFIVGAIEKISLLGDRTSKN
jgi:uncharacterized membrane protein